MQKLHQGQKGFTLIELVIVIVIIGILATISVPIYRGYTRRAMAAEGRSLAGAIAKAEKIYYAEHTTFFSVGTATSNDTTLGVDSRMNKYFTNYTVAGNASAFTVTTTGTGDAAGITVTLTQTASGGATMNDAGI